MEWKKISDAIMTVKDLANNEEIKRRLESISLYTSEQDEESEADSNTGEDIIPVINKDLIKQNTLAKIHELRGQADQAATEEEAAANLIEFFLYIDNYLSLFSEPEYFFTEDVEGVKLRSAEMLHAENKSSKDAIQSIFFFQELNEGAHSSLYKICNLLNGNAANVAELFDTIYYLVDRLDSLNQQILEQDSSDAFVKQLYPFILLSNYTVQRLFLHRFASHFPHNVDRAAFYETVKRKNDECEKIKNEIIKRAYIIKSFSEQIFYPMHQAIKYDSRCISVFDDSIITDSQENGNAQLLTLQYDRILKCCEASYWISFLVSNIKNSLPGKEDAETDRWFDLYAGIVKNAKYSIVSALNIYLTKNGIYNSYGYNNFESQPVNKKGKKDLNPSSPKIIMPKWLVLIIAAVLAAAFAITVVMSSLSIKL